MTDKELAKRDLLNLMRINARLSYDDVDEVKRTYDMALQSGMFKTALGQNFMKRLAWISEGKKAPHTCFVCRRELDNDTMVCHSCQEKYNRIQTVEKKQPAPAIKGGLDVITSKINEMAGESGAVDLKLRDLFSNVCKKHTRMESEEIFSAGTLKTTPAESEIATSWPKPWLFSRILLALLVSFGLLCVCVQQFGNINAVPGAMFLGALAVPFSVLVFIFETNAPRNISIFEVAKMFCYGGAASLVLTLILYEIFPVGELDYTGAVMVGLIEELGKILVAAVFIKQLNAKYLLNGMLIGAAVGSGFAVFETAGYAFRFGVGTFIISPRIDVLLNEMVDILFLRGWSSIGSHVAWSAIAGAGLLLAKGSGPFETGNLTSPKFLTFFIIAVALHAVWDCPFMADDVYIKLFALIAIAWIVILVLLSVGLKQIQRFARRQ